MSYDIFKNMISELFQNEEFTEPVYIEGRQYKCICSPINNGVMFTQAGMVDDCNFVLDIEIATTDRLPEQNDKVIFRQKQYKVSHTETDSANASMKLYLISLSKGK